MHSHISAEKSMSGKAPGTEDMEARRQWLIENPEHRHLPPDGALLGQVSTTHGAQGNHNNNAGVTSIVSSVNWTEDGLVSSSKNFSRIRRISALTSRDELLATIKNHESLGEPLIIEGWHNHPEWNSDLFSIETFVGDVEQTVDARNVRTAEDVKMTLRGLVQIYQAMSKNTIPGEKQRFYGKDIQCPECWNDWLKSGALPDHIVPFGTSDMFSHLPVEDRPETLMCYLGIGDTYTPAHKDLCGSFGQNIMCYTEDGGSAFWFMTTTGPLHTDDPTMYFREKLRADLDLEDHTTTVAELKDAPFQVYIAQQHLGDLVLVPPRSCHQVVNHGGITIKMSWSRMGLKSFELSLYDELPLYRRVCRQEVYRVKLNIFHAVLAYTRRLSDFDTSASSSDSRLPTSSCQDLTPPMKTVDAPLPLFSQRMETISTLESLLHLLEVVLSTEWVSTHEDLKLVPEMHSCDFCGADIFQSFFMCSRNECTNERKLSEFVCCPGCYIEGRSCTCEGGYMEPCQTRPFGDLIRALNDAALAVNNQSQLCSPSTLDQSSHPHVFAAACMLRQRKFELTDKPNGKLHRRCTTRANYDPAHDAPSTHVLYCTPCHAFLCFRHILDLHGLHAVQALHTYAQDADQTQWHAKHKALPSKTIPSSPDLAERMAWAALKFRRCRPIDAVRAREGFYDDFKLIASIDDVGEGQKPDEATEVTSSSNISTQNGMSAPTPYPRSGTVSSLTELESDSDMDIDDSSYAGPSRTPSPPTSRCGPRFKATAKAKAVPGKREHPRQIFDCVLLQHSRKRCVSPNTASLMTPMKKARTGALLDTPMADTSSPFISGPSNVATTPVVPTKPGILPFRQNTLVPVTPNPASGSLNGHKTPVSQVAFGARLDKLPPNTRLGPPTKRVIRRRVSSSPESSLDQLKPAIIVSSSSKRLSASSTPKKKLAPVPPIQPENPTKESARISDLEFRLKQVLNKVAKLESENSAMKRQGSDYRNQIAGLKAKLSSNNRLREEKNSKRTADLDKQKLAQLEDEIKALRRTGEDRDKLVKSLQSLVEARATTTEQDRALSSTVYSLATAFGQGIGAAVQRPQAGLSHGNMQVDARPQASVQYALTRSFIHPRGGWQSRGRMHGHRNNFAGGTSFQPRYSNQRFEDGHRFRGRSTHFDTSRGQLQRYSSIDRRKLTDERQYESFRDDTHGSRRYYSDDPESSLQPSSSTHRGYDHDDRDWGNVTQLTRERSITPRRSPSPHTPPRTGSYSPPITHSNVEEDREYNSERGQIPETSQEIPWHKMHFENPGNPNYIQPDEEEHEPPIGQEQDIGGHDGPELVQPSTEDNPWADQHRLLN